MEEQSSSDFLNDLEVAKKMEDEHLHLQRQVREIQTDRLHRTMGVHPMFRRQDNLLKALKDEYISLIKDLKIARSGAHKKKDKKMKNDLKTALLQMEKFEIDCIDGLAIMEEYDELLVRNMKKMLHLKKKNIACQGEIEHRRFQSQNRLISAENKLETAMLRFNSIQYDNKKIREEIEHMLKDRALFKQEWDRMLTALKKGKKFLTDLFDSSAMAYDQRDEWYNKLRSIQEKGKIEQMQQVQEMRELTKAYDHEMKIYNFLAKKGLIRVNHKEEERQEQQKRDEIERTWKEYNKHVKILNDIYNYTGETNINKIIEGFIKKEQHNFAIYELLTDYCAENEVLRRGLEDFRRDIYDRRDYIDQKDAQALSKIADLTEQIEKKKLKNEELRQKVESKNRLLNGTMEKIQDIFRMLNCSMEPFQNLLGDKQPSLHHLDLTLRLITDKIKEHIEIVYYFERVLKPKAEKSKEALRLPTGHETLVSRLKKYTVRADPPVMFTPIPINLLVPADPCPSCIETRWLSRVIDAPEVPFNQLQVQAALNELASDPAYMFSDRVHALTECRATASRKLLATRHLYQ